MTTPLPLKPCDGLEVTALVDNAIDFLLPDTEVARRAPLGRNAHLDAPLIAEHGFAALVTLRAGERRRTFLFDTGLSPHALTHNLDVLQLSPREIEAIVLSHGHRDHTTGLLGLAQRLGRRRLPLILHPDAWLDRRVVLPSGEEIRLPPPDRAALRAEGVEVVEERGPSLLCDGLALVTGQVPRRTRFEKGFPVHQARSDGGWRPDPLIHDDQAVVLHVREKGLVVLTGCGHSGLVNTLRYAQRLTGVERVYAVFGGFHLTGPLFEPIIPQTVRALRRLAPRVVVPGHCTGWRAVQRIARALPGAFLPNSVGTRYVL